jgi:hypothetical protein
VSKNAPLIQTITPSLILADVCTFAGYPIAHTRAASLTTPLVNVLKLAPLFLTISQIIQQADVYFTALTILSLLQITKLEDVLACVQPPRIRSEIFQL